jgi:hypothetical protein
MKITLAMLHGAGVIAAAFLVRYGIGVSIPTLGYTTSNPLYIFKLAFLLQTLTGIPSTGFDVTFITPYIR